MTYSLLYKNIARINLGIISNYSFVELENSKFTLDFIDFLYLNNYISNYIIKKKKIVIFFKFSISGPIIRKFIMDSKIHLWRWYRYKRLISSKSLFIRKYKKSELGLVILHTAKGFLFFETAYLKQIGGKFICQLKV